MTAALLHLVVVFVATEKEVTVIQYISLQLSETNVLPEALAGPVQVLSTDHRPINASPATLVNLNDGR